MLMMNGKKLKPINEMSIKELEKILINRKCFIKEEFDIEIEEIIKLLKQKKKSKFTYREDIPLAKNSFKHGLSKREIHNLKKLERLDKEDNNE